MSYAHQDDRWQLAHYLSSGALLADAVVTSDTFAVLPMLSTHFGAAGMGLDAPDGPLRRVAGPLFAFTLQVPDASAGASLSFIGSPTPDFAIAVKWLGFDVSASGNWTSCAAHVTDASFKGVAVIQTRAPFPFWRAVFQNGPDPQGADFVLSILAGGF